MSEPTISLLSF